MLTAWANDSVLSPLLWQAQVVLAGGTLLINMGFSITHFALLKIDHLLRLFDQGYKFLVFLLSFVNIS